jgi:hypothetical protein
VGEEPDGHERPRGSGVPSRPRRPRFARPARLTSEASGATATVGRDGVPIG